VSAVLAVVVRHPERFGHRTGRTVVSVQDAAGHPLADAEVTVAQRSHRFGFGAIGFDLLPLAAARAGTERNVFGGADGNSELLADLFLELFDTATPPFYWRGFEPRRGHPDTDRLAAAARWFADRGVPEGTPAGVAHPGTRLAVVARRRPGARRRARPGDP
jgi:endo-1,4-beta-xylanase